MSAASEAQQIERIGRLLAAICAILIIVLPIALAAFWALADAARLAVHSNLPPEALHASLLPWQRVAGGLLAGVPLALLMPGLWQARRCFALFADGQIFNAESARCLRSFAGWVTALVAAGLMTEENATFV